MSLKLIGAQLRAAREKRGLSLMDLAHQTRIPVQRLEWLEQDNYAAFGSLTYARAFLKIYSGCLGVDPQDTMERLPSTRLGGVRDYRYLTETLGPWIMTPHPAAPDVTQLGIKTSRSPVPAGLALFVLLLAGTGIWGHHVSQEQAFAPDSASKAAPAPVEMISVQADIQLPTVQEILGARPVVHPVPAVEAGKPENLQ